VSLVETTDASANVVIGVAKSDQTLSEKSFLLLFKEMSAVNHTTIARVFNEAMQTVWPDGVKLDNVLSLVTDAAPRMKKTAQGLSVSYPKLVTTQWGTWLDATVYYAENFEIFCCVVNEFDGDDASSITI
jgi:hypothetical protein